jgi:hypothetical protein
MAKKPAQSESRDKAEASDDPKAGTPMGRFKSLTRSLLNVSRAELQTEQKRYLEDRSVKKTPSPSGESRRTKK